MNVNVSNENKLTGLALKNVFVAGPFFKLVNPETGLMPAKDQELIEGLISHFEAAGANVYNAHRRERWGADFMEPPEYTKLDFDQISESDLLVALPGSPASLGTHIELGWASALGKPMVLLLDKNGEYAGMIQGLAAVSPAVIVEFSHNSVDSSQLDAAVLEVMARGRSAA